MDITGINGASVAASMQQPQAQQSPPPGEGVKSKAKAKEEAPALDVQENVATKLEPQEVEQLVSDLTAELRRINNELQIEVDDETGSIIVKLVDPETGEVVRQVPLEETLAVRESIKNLSGLLYDNEG